MLRKISTPFLAFLQSTSLVVYLLLVSCFFTFITPEMNKEFAQFYAPVVMLLLFVLSAVISSVLILGKSAVLFWNKKYRECFTLLGWTIGWGIFYFILFVAFFYLK